MPSSENIYKLTKNDIEKASSVLTDAFTDYPTFKHLFPEMDERKKKLRSVMTFFLKCGLLYGEVIAPSKNIEGVAIWYKSNNLHFGFIKLLKAGLIKTIFNLNIKTFKRFKKIGDAKRANRDKILKTDYFLLDLIGIDPLHEKQGYAGLLINKMLDKFNKENKSCFLETSNSKNIGYYTKFGFSLLCNYKCEDIESYCMIK